MKKPAIYVFTTAYDPFIGGAEIAIRETVTRLSNSFSFFIFTARLKAELPRIETKGDITIIRVGFGNKTDKLLLIPLISIEAIRWFSKHPPALLWSVMISYAFPAAVILKWWQGVPLLLTLQEGNKEWEFQWKNLSMSWLGWRVALKNTDSLAAISSFLLTLARTIGYRGEGVVIPNGVAVERFASPMKSRQIVRKELTIPENAFLLITASRLVHKNGVDIVLQALARLPESYRNATHFLIVGGGELEEELKDLTKSLGLLETVHFIGEKGNDELPDLLASADAFVRPSRSEGLGTSFIEALAAGLPAVGANVGGIPDVIQNGRTGLLAEPENPNDLAKKIVLLQENHVLAKSLAETGADWVREQFTWEAVTKKYRSLFSRLIKKKSRILIATGIYPPDIGGTAKIASLFRERFQKSEFETLVLAYGEGRHIGVVRTTRNLPTGMRHLRALFTALPLVRRSNAVFLLDHFSLGFPVALAARILRRPYLVRVGGDFLWESHVEGGRRETALPDYYEKNERPLKERIIFKLARWTLGHADEVIFTTHWQEKIFKKAYALKRTHVIENPCPQKHLNSDGSDKIILYAGRFIYLKNLKRLLRAFSRFRKTEIGKGYSLVLVGEGPEEGTLRQEAGVLDVSDQVVFERPLSHAALMQKVQYARAVSLPSFSDVSPNLALEALSFGVPVILTRHSGYEMGEGEGVLRVDPFDEGELVLALERVADPGSYKNLKRAAEAFTCASGEDMANQYIAKLTEVIS